MRVTEDSVRLAIVADVEYPIEEGRSREGTLANREDLKNWVYEAVKDGGGVASIVEVARHIWTHHEAELRTSGDLFYKWQYDMRWAAQKLRNSKKLAFAGKSWALVR